MNWLVALCKLFSVLEYWGSQPLQLPRGLSICEDLIYAMECSTFSIQMLLAREKWYGAQYMAPYSLIWSWHSIITLFASCALSDGLCSQHVELSFYYCSVTNIQHVFNQTVNSTIAIIIAFMCRWSPAISLCTNQH